ncbi:superinfection immunity protein [Aureimonas sp. AU4]|uniref:superinfection immunity protein n=1 Tax=Aureimonas sp. AU4 TaxID=1638163 RepID=UPI000785EC72|nr:superinfection immunity protein [Aureimonas sp. AU4]
MSEELFILLFYGVMAALWLVVLLIFAIPSFVAFRRHHPNRWLILAVNIGLGGTGIGWCVALVWALRIVHLPGDANGSRGGESGLNLFANDIRRVRVEPSMHGAARRHEGTPPSSGAALHQIERLRQLLDAGHIDQAEFAQLKAAALRGI